MAEDNSNSNSSIPSDCAKLSTTTTAPHKDSNMPDSLNFLHYVAKLKHLDRTGWVHNEIERPETVAGHMYRMAILSAFLVEESTGLDINKCIKMSIVHDLGESIVGDITPNCGVSNADKYEKELAAIGHLSALVPATRGKEMRELFQEYEDGQTVEAQFVMGIDKFDMVLQAYEYERREQKPKFLQAFFDSTKTFFEGTHPFVKKLVGQLNEARDNQRPFSF